MDEQIAFYEIKNILYANSFENFFKAIVFGDQRYGRIIYYITSVLLFIPERIYGESGQIFLTRTIFAIVLFASYIILVKTFIRDKFISYCTLFFLLFIQTNLYFFTEPKPEPFQLLFLSFFLYYYKKQNYKSFYFIFLGFAFGCKISLLFLVIFFFAINFLLLIKKSINFKSILIKFSYFMTGLFISVPILFTSILNLKNLKIYIGSTFLATSFGSDNNGVNFIDWINKIINHCFTDYLYINIIILSIICILIVISFVFKFKKNYLNNSDITFTFLISLILILPIIFLTKRIWLHYIHIGIVFLIISAFISLESHKLNNKIFKIITYIVLIIFSSFVLSSFIPKLKIKSLRTKEQVYINQKKNYQIIKKAVSNTDDTIYLSPQHFKLERKNTIYIYGYFNEWLKYPKFVVLSNSNNPIITRVINKNQSDYNQYLESYKLYNEYVIQKKIYKLIYSDSSQIGLYIYKLNQ
jgi:hypothetical protein